MFLTFNFRKKFKFFLFLVFTGLILFISAKAFNIVFPIKFEGVIEKYSSQYNLDKDLVFSVINIESRFDPLATSSKGAKGLMQIMPSTAEWIIQKAKMTDLETYDLYQPDINIRLGCWYLSYFLQQYNDLDLALASYNAGRGNVLKWLDNEEYSEDGKTLTTIPFKETENYLKKANFFIKSYKYIFKIRDFFKIN